MDCCAFNSLHERNSQTAVVASSIQCHVSQATILKRILQWSLPTNSHLFFRKIEKGTTKSPSYEQASLFLDLNLYLGWLTLVYSKRKEKSRTQRFQSQSRPYSIRFSNLRIRMISAVSDRLLLLLLFLLFLLLFLVVSICPMLTILQWPIVISSPSPDNSGEKKSGL